MIQVHYRWCLHAGQEGVFQAAWARATRVIRETRAGCLGSMLIRGTGEQDLLVATAFWESVDAWNASRALGPAEPESTKTMRSSADLVSTEVFEVLDDQYTRARR